MKKIVTILILSFLSLGIKAQKFNIPDYDFRLGVTATPTIGWVKPMQGKTEGAVLGFSYGILGDFNFAENYSFSTGLTITSINGKSTEVNVARFLAGSNTNPQTYDLKYKLQYIELPLTAKIKTSKTAGQRWYGQLGLSNDFNISAKQNAVLPDDSKVSNQNISDYTKFYRAGLIIGGGGEFDMSEKTSIVAGLTFNNGFTNIVTDKNRDVRNHYLALNFGLLF